ncbi:MAG: hypothetical protein L7S64_03115 [Longimicrobiales bacterium]|nr:hypothetical protein [Longimicrobiales bacterium]
MSAPFLTLEPLIEALREAVEASGWDLSGLQKTTSHQFEGRWDGESTRSAYLFFHRPDGPDFASVDIYLDETSRGLTGNIAIVVDLVPLGVVGEASHVLTALARLSARELEGGQRRPITLRFRMDDAEESAESADTEVRFKVRLPRSVLRAGRPTVFSWTDTVMAAFAEILRSPELALLTEADEPADE